MNEFLAMRVVEGAILFGEVPNNRKSSVAAILNEQGHGDLVTEDVPSIDNDASDAMNEFFNDIRQGTNRIDWNYAFKDWGHTEINLPYEINAQTVSYMFMSCPNLGDASNIKIIVTNNTPSMYGFCMESPSMVLPPDVTFQRETEDDAFYIKDWTSAYAGCTSLETCKIYFGDGTQDAVTQRNSMRNTFYGCQSLINIVFEGKGSPYKLDLSKLNNLSKESITNLSGALLDVSEATEGNYDIKISETMLLSLSDDEKASFTNLGWNLISA